MKLKLFSLLTAAFVLSPLFAYQAHALSCLPVDMYLKDVVGKDEIVIFVGKSENLIEENGYTIEVLNVSEVKQGYAENEIFAYHQKDATWGYLCNNGPKVIGSEGVYIAERDHAGKYNVYQRLDMDDPLVDTLETDLAAGDITGSLGEITKTDRMNQLMTTIKELFTEITLLLKEYIYWKSN